MTTIQVQGMAGKVALVTGGSSGIGREACLAFGRQGATVVVHYRSGQDRAEAVVRQIESTGGKALALGADLTVSDEIRALIDQVRTHCGRLDILVNNAGDPVRRSPFIEVDEALLDYTIALNLKAPFLLTQAALPLLQASRGVVLNISTAATRRPASTDSSHYATAKGGLNVLTLALAHELSPLGIRVNCLCPGFIHTELHERLSTPERRARAAQHNLLQRAGTPEEIAEAIVFLASDACEFINGQIIYADGGRA